MKKIKKIFKQDFDNSLDVKLSYDAKSLESNKKTYINWRRHLKITGIVLGCCVLIIALFPVFIFGGFRSSYRQYNKHYSINEIQNMQETYFKSLNRIDRIKSNSSGQYITSESFNADVVRFSTDILEKFAAANKDNSYLISPLSLFGQLSLYRYLTSDEEVLSGLFDLIGQSSPADYRKMMDNNYYANESGTMSMHSGAFISNEYQVRGDFVDNLTSYYTETYGVDFKNAEAVNLMEDWIANFANYKDVNINSAINSETVLMLVSTLYFDNNWDYRFDENKTTNQPFYFADGTTIERKFMNHTYNKADNLFDHGKYISVYDYFKNGEKIKYIVPKSTDDNIDDLDISSSDVLFNENREQKDQIYDSKYIDLFVPKIDFQNQISFTDILKQYPGLNKILDKEGNTLDKIYTKADYINSYIYDVVQNNAIKFSKTGVQATTFTLSFGAASAGPIQDSDTYEVKLNQSFIYVIYDTNNLPIYIGKYNG